MGQDEAKAYLMRFRETEQEIDALLERRGWCEARALSAAHHMHHAPTARKYGDKTGEAVGDMVDIDRQIEGKMERLLQLRRAYYALTAPLPPQEREIILRRYLLGNRWETVAEKLALGSRQVFRLHQAALEKLEVPRS